MKKLYILIFLLFAALAAQVENFVSTNAEETMQQTKTVIIGLMDDPAGFLAAYWWLVILAIVGIGRIIVKITPSQEDDKWYNRNVVGLVNKTFTVLGLGRKK